LAIVPAGTGNNLFKGLGLSFPLEEAYRIALFGNETRTIDVVEIRAGRDGEKIFMVQTSALGFPAKIAGQYDRLRKSPFLRRLVAPFGNSAYTLLSLGGLASQKVHEWRGKGLLQVRFSMPGEELQETVLAIFLGNEKSIGGGFVPCPGALVDDGLMDLCYLRAGTRASYLKILHDVRQGKHLSARETVVYRQTPGPVELEISSSIPLLVDGDLPVESDRYRFTLLPKRLAVVVG
jgi:diacylglycerol kinase (ATP)